MRSLARALCLGSVGGLLLACGGSAPAQAPKSEPLREETPTPTTTTPSTIEEAEAQIQAAALALSGVTPAPDSKADTAATAPAQPASPSAEPSGPRVESSPPPRSPGKAPVAGGAAPRATAHDPCESSCRALASMRRAVEALCRMTGDNDARCSTAHETLATSERRIASCHCRG